MDVLLEHIQYLYSTFAVLVRYVAIGSVFKVAQNILENFLKSISCVILIPQRQLLFLCMCMAQVCIIRQSASAGGISIMYYFA